MKHLSKITVAAMVAAFGISLAMPVVAMALPQRLTNQDKTVTAGEIRQALQNTPGVLDAAVSAQSRGDADSALVTTNSNTSVDVPRDAARGIRLADNQSDDLTIMLPNAASAGTAQTVANGTVSYPSANGSANAVQTNTDGSVRMLTVIDNPSAPTRYDYTFDLPKGAQMRLAQDGSVAIIDTQNKQIARIAKPWARDAAGSVVATHYVVTANTLSQMVYHTKTNVQYPVTADPSISFGWNVYVNFTKSETALFKKYQEAGYAGWALTSLVCGKIPNSILQAGCAVLGTAKGAQLQFAIRRATESRSCLQLAVPYTAYYNVATASALASFGWRNC